MDINFRNGFEKNAGMFSLARLPGAQQVGNLAGKVRGAFDRFTRIQKVKTYKAGKRFDAAHSAGLASTTNQSGLRKIENKIGVKPKVDPEPPAGPTTLTQTATQPTGKMNRKQRRAQQRNQQQQGQQQSQAGQQTQQQADQQGIVNVQKAAPQPVAEGTGQPAGGGWKKPAMIGAAGAAGGYLLGSSGQPKQQQTPSAYQFH